MKNTKMGRSLDLSGLQNSQKSVTLGFTVEGRTKYSLAQEAESMDLTLSQYMQLLVENRNDDKGLYLKDKIQVLESVNETNEEYIQSLESKMELYERGVLAILFEKYRGQTISYTDNEGISRNQRINECKDIFKVIISTIKI